MKTHKTLYNYRDSKKIYLSSNSLNSYLFEKKNYNHMQICQLLKRNPTVTYSKSGVVIFSLKNR